MNRENKHLFVRFLRHFYKLSISTLAVLLSFTITSFSEPIVNHTGKNSTSLPPLITSTLSDYNGMNISCYGLNDGWIDITVNGIGPFTYSWSTGEITEDISNLVAGTYTVTVTDANSETTIESFILSEPDKLIISDNISNTSCANNNGSIDITVSGGMPAFTYLWSNSAITEDISGLAGGSYTVTVTDINNCIDSAAFVVASSTQPVIVIDSVKNVSCFNGTDGAVYISVTGNNGPVSYAWSNGNISEDLLNVIAGSYTLTITDSLGCVATISQAITQPTDITATLTPTNATCGQSNGSITTLVSGGTPAYTYLWNTGAVTSSITNVVAGTYTVTVTDSKLCTKSFSQTISNLSGPVVTVDSVKNVSCFGGNNGGIYISVTGNNGPVTYLWNTGAVSNNLLNVIAGNYTVTVTDSSGCVATISQAITQPTDITATLTPTSATCGQNNGSITTSVSGGTPAYTYLWNTGAVTSSLSNVAAGTYTVTVTDSKLCTKAFSQTISNLSGPVVTVDSVKNVSCFGGNNGSIYISVTGNNGPVTYLWSTGAVSNNLLNVIAGNYTVTVTDSSGCIATKTQAITQPTAIAATLTPTSATCGQNNGSITTSVSGGTPAYTYLWNTGAVTSSITNVAAGTYTVTITDSKLCTKAFSQTISNLSGPVVTVDSVKNVSCFGGNNGGIYISVTGNSPFTYAWSSGAVSQDLTNVVAGTYTVTVTDNANCQAVVSRTITQPTDISATLTPTSATCGQNNGSITTLVSGGTPAYTYLWNTGAVTSSITNVAAGTYTVTVTDSKLCTKAFSQTISNLSGPVVTVDSVKNVSCFGGNNGGIYISVTGNSPFTYAWSSGAVSQDLTNVVAGTYTVTVTDNANCQAVVSRTITQPTDITATLTPTIATCGQSNGSITTLVSGGTPAYTYLWNTGAVTSSLSNVAAGTYTVTVTDSKLCTKAFSQTISNLSGPVVTVDSVKNVSCFGGNNGSIYISVTGNNGPVTYLWSTGAVSNNLLNVIAGNYTVTVTDSSGCIATKTQAITQPTAIAATLTPTSATCGQNNGSITTLVSGGTPAYTYLWNTGAVTSSITNVAAGTYTVTITDSKLCTKAFSQTISNLSGPVVTVDSVKNVSCFGGNNGGIYISVSGNSPFTYAWSSGAVSQDLTNVVAGTYTVTVTDNANCQAVVSRTITQPTDISATLTPTNATCGQNNGSITTSVSGGTPAYTYLWNTGATTSSITNVAAGTYTVTITDSKLCTKAFSQTISNLSGPVVTVDSVKNVSCFGGNNGGIYISVTGNSPFTYAWSSGAVSQDLTNVVAGTYTVTVTDNSNCQAVVSRTITQPTDISATLTPTSATCGQNNGSITTSVSGGTPAYTYLWNTGAVTSSITNVAAGTYTVTITDSKLCTKAFSQTISNLSGPVVTVDSVKNVSCFGGSNGSIYISVTGNSPFTYAWSSGAVSQDLANVVAGTYTVTVTDNSNCQAVVSRTITQPTDITIILTPTNAACGQNNGNITSLVSGGTAGYSYLWSNGALTPNISNIIAGSYTLTVTDSKNCTKVTSAVVSNASGPVVTVDSVKNVSCFGGSNGSIYISVTGNSPFTYAWSSGAVSQDLTNVVAGTYTVTVTDNSNCQAVVSRTITHPTDISATLTPTSATCGQNNGSITTLVSGGTPAYTYLWNTGAVTSSITNVAAGTYTVTITDSKLCTKAFSQTISNLSGPVVTVDSVKNVSCFGGSNGSIYISVTGNNGSVTYLWNTGAVSKNLLNVVAGNYTVTVTDSSGCIATKSQVISQPASALSITVSSLPASCGSANGSASATVTGGTPVYTYLWNTGQTTSSITNVAGGIYTVTVTDNKGCTSSKPVIVNTQSSVQIVIDSIIQLKCFGQNTGAILTHATGGSGVYTYTWTPAQANNDSIFNLGPGIYKLVVHDNAGCADSITVTINPVTPLVINGSALPEVCSNNNGSAWATVSGGTPPYNYLWNTGSVNDTIFNLSKGNYTVTVTDSKLCTATHLFIVDSLGGPSIQDSIVNVKCFGGNNGAIYTTVSGGNGAYSYQWSPGGQTTSFITGLIAGTYTVTVSDTNACSASKIILVTQPSAINVTLSAISEKCNKVNGIAVASASGGIGPYTYLWNTGVANDSLINKASGWYSVTVTDANLCTKVDSVFIPHINGPTINGFTRSNPVCNSDSTGSLTVNVTGGTPAYTYQWSAPAGVTGASNTNIPAGIYTVTVTDINGCSATSKDTLFNPPLLLISHTSTNASCALNNGIATFNVTGGATPYSYLWSNGATGTNQQNNLSNGIYTITVTDGNGCVKQDTVTVNRTPATMVQLDSSNNVSCYGLSDGNIYITPSSGTGNYSYQWSYNNLQTQDLTNIPGGIYTVTVTDGAGCSYTMPDINILSPDSLSITFTTTPTGCSGPTGSATAQVTGGTASYTYLWSNGTTNATAVNLSNQNYTVTVTDQNNCSKSATVFIASTLPINASVSSFQNVTCYGDSTGSIQITAGGGTSPLTYLWSNGATTSDIFQLTAGTYTLTITDAVQCTTTITQTITQNPKLQFGLTLIPGPCNGGTPGSAVASPSGGSSAPTLLWSDGSTGTLVQGVAGTVFTLTITDNSGCHRDTTFSIPSTNGPQIVSVNTTDIVCFGDSSGTATIQITGGAAPITYQWIGTSPVQNTATAVNLSQGNYTCIVSDVNGCTASAVATINHLFPAIQPVLTINNASCGNSNGQIAVTATGGSGGFVYALNNGAFVSDSVYTNIAPGIDTVRIKDNSGCIVTVLATVSNIQGPEITVLDSANVSCFGNNDGSITLNVSGAAQPITYLWNDSTVSLTRNNLPPGNYTFTATDANNCVTVRNFIITEPPQIIITEIISQNNPPFNISCNGKSDGEINLFVTGGVPGSNANAYSYQWSISGVTGSTAGSLSAGPYTVTVTDSTGCSATKSFTLTEPPALYAGNDFTVSICGIDTSTLTASTPLYGLGKWILKSGSAVIVHPDSVSTPINTIGNGVNVFAWVVYDNNCSDTAIYIINKKEKIIADAGIDQDVCETFVFLSAVPPQSGTGIWSVLSGSSQIENDSSAQTKVEHLNSGLNGFMWTITNGNCTSSDTIIVKVLPPEQCYTDVVLPTGFTPNDDGYNDLYEIRGLDYNENKFSVYNRWGNLVYEKKNYRNNWDGRSNSNQILPDGTYYAIFSIPARNIILKTFIDLRR